MTEDPIQPTPYIYCSGSNLSSLTISWFRLATMTLSNLIFKPLNENVLAIVDL